MLVEMTKTQSIPKLLAQLRMQRESYVFVEGTASGLHEDGHLVQTSISVVYMDIGMLASRY